MKQATIAPDFRFRVILEITADWQFWVRENGAIEYVSTESERISGYPREDILTGKVRLRDYVHPEDYPMIRARYQSAIEGKEGHDIEFRVHRKDGGTRWGSLSFVPVRDEAGRSFGFRGSIRDITDRKEAELLVQRERDTLGKVVSSIGAGLLLVDRSQRIIWYNSVIESRFGPLDGNRGKICYETFKDRTTACKACPVIRAFEGGCDARAEHPGVTLPGGEVRDFLNIATPLRGLDGSFDQCLELILDVTESRAIKAERKKLREELFQSQKMEAVGTLAGGIAHEFNNLLTGILGFTSLLQMQAGPESPNGKSLGMIDKSARRAAELTGQLLGFARKGTRNVQEMCLNEIVALVLSIVRHTFDRAIAIREDMSRELWAMEGDPGQIEQVLFNLCINARDAMPSGGTLTVRTCNDEVLSTRSVLTGTLAPGRWVSLTVQDTGTGIAPSVRERIFEPFFTTKEPGKGTGMGLSVVYGIVQSHGGAIDVDSAPGSGTTFLVYFPAKTS
ncbi:MAG: PAS domain S-box protein [Deltaproteobacteria bacterium]|nr:PAS domain S-box protein [Deltaproteobacteria bacterium]